MKRHAALNRLYRLVWSQVRNAWIAVPEVTRGRGKESGRKLAAAVLSLCIAEAYAGPLGGAVVSGAGNISQAGAVTTIQQSSANLSLTWKSFNVGTQETVNFLQPSASAIAVNRISDVNGSQILGNINANGQVWLINPNGILFGQGAQVNVGGLVASTLDVSDASLSDASRSFSGNGTGSVVNLGAIHAAEGGSVALLGNTVRNQGSIVARLGTVALGAGSAATLTFNGTSLVRMQVDSSVLNSAAENGGLIRADGGLVLMSAGAKDALLASVVNNTGVIEARTVEAHEGDIVLMGGMAAGSTIVGGTLDASAPNGGNGGSIETSGAQVTVANNALVTTSAPGGATGNWLIDPYNVTISAGTGTTGGSFVANANDSVMNATTLQTALATTNVTVTTGSSGSQAGNITVTAPLTWSAATTLGLTAAGAIAIDAPITITGAGGLNLTASAQAGITTTGLTFASGASVDYGAADHGGTFRLDGNNYTLVYSMAELDAIDGLNAVDGTALTAYGAGLSGNYALATSLSATGTTYTRALISTDSSNAVTAGFMGSLDGLGHTVTGLTINAAAMTNSVALIGSATNGSVSNIGLVNANVNGYDNVGALVGYSWGETVQTSFADGTVTGHKDVGGLVGGTRSHTLIQASYTGGTVAGSQYTGGLVGDLNFTSALKTSYSTSAVSGVDATGGLAGDVSLSTVLDSYSTGAVSGTTSTGGLIGQFNTSATALVTGSFWDTQTSGNSTSAGGAGVVGLTTAQMRTQANFTSATTANGNVNPAWDLAGTWAIYDGETMPLLRSFLTPLVVTANSTSKTYDDVAYAGVNGVTYSVTPNSANLFGTVSYADLSQGAVNAGSYAVTPSGQYSNQQGYAIAYAAGALTIAPATLTVTANTANRLYGASDPAFSGSVTGFVRTDTLLNATTGSEVFGTTALAGSNVGSYAIDGSGLSANNGNYVFAQATGNATALTIDAATLTVTANAASRLYGATDPTYGGSVTGFVGTDTLANATTGSEAFTTTALSNSNVGSYAIDGAGLSANHGNYVFAQASGNATALTIDAATLTVTANAANRLYGAVDPAFSGTVTGFAGTDTLANSTTGSETFATTALTSSNVGSYAIDGSGLSANNGNYVFAQAGSNASALTINAATLTVTANAASRLYGAVDPAFSGSVTGFVGTDTLVNATTGSETFSTAALSTSNVGSYAVNGSGLSANNGNYVFAQAAGNATALTINAATLTVAADAASRLYGATDPTYTGTVTGFVGTDTLANATTGSEAFTTTALAGSNVGSYAIDGAGLTANHGNYVFAQAAGNAAALTINPATLTVTADAASRLYGAADPTYTGNVTGFVGTDTLANATTGTESFTTTAPATSNVGSYAIDGAGLTANHGNYVFAQAAGNATALTIDAATLTVTADAASRLYGAADPTYTGTVTGFVGTDTLANATTGTESFTTTALATSNVGSYAIAGTGLSADHGNYVFVQAAVNASALTINPATLTVTADAANRLYGAPDPTYTGNVTGFVGTDTLANATSGSEAFTTTALAASNVGSYAIDGAGLSANHGNYVFAQAAGNATALTISPATLTVTADAANRLYGATDPTYTGTVTGFVGTDTLANATSGSEAFTTTALANSNVGSYAIDGAGLSASHGNYVFAQASGNATALTIDAATLTVTANAAARLYGAVDPAFSGDVTGFVGTDTLANATTGSEAFTTTAMANSNVGGYAIDGSGLSANHGNYVFAQASGNASALTISPATLTVTSTAASRPYGASDPAYAGSVSGFVAGDTLGSATTGSEVFTTTALVTSNVGSYAIEGTGLTANHGNYVFAQATNNATALTIDPATLTVTADAATRLYGATDPTYTGSVTGFVGTDTLVNATTGSEAFTTTALASSNVGSYAIDGAGLTANHGNYVFAQAIGNATALTIAPATLTVTANAATRVYGAVDPTFSGSVTGFVGTDTLASATTGSEAFTTTALVNSNVGSHAIDGSGLSADHGNYVFAQAAGNATALTVTPATLTYAANAASRVYGAADPAYSGSVTGFVAGDDLATATTGSAAFTTNAIANSNIGQYGLAGFGLIANNGNYVFTQAAGNANALTVTPATLTLTSNLASRAVGAADPAFSGRVTGFVAGDTQATATTGSLSYSTDALVDSVAGRYAIDSSGLSANSGNYVFVQASTNATALTIVPDFSTERLQYVLASLTQADGDDFFLGPLSTPVVKNGRKIAVPTAPGLVVLQGGQRLPDDTLGSEQ